MTGVETNLSEMVVSVGPSSPLVRKALLFLQLSPLFRQASFSLLRLSYAKGIIF